MFKEWPTVAPADPAEAFSGGGRKELGFRPRGEG